MSTISEHLETRVNFSFVFFFFFNDTATTEIYTLSLHDALPIFLKNFNWAFVKFHELFFAGNWRFPNDFLLIKLYPQQFWIDITSKIVSNVLITANILIVIGVIMLIIFRTTKRGG